MLSVLRKASDGLNLLAEVIIAVLMVALVIVVSAQVFFRYVVFNSLPWSEEASRYMLIWVTFLGASVGVKRQAHFTVQAVTGLLPTRAQRGLVIVTYLLAMVVFFVMVYFGWQNVQVTSRQVSVAMSVPMHYVYGAIPTAGAIMMVHTLLHLLGELRAPGAVPGGGGG